MFIVYINDAENISQKLNEIGYKNKILGHVKKKGQPNEDSVEFD